MAADNLRVERQLCVALHRASRAVIACYRPLLKPLGLTYSQYMVMLVLWQQERSSQRELAEVLDLDSGTLSPVLKRLEQQGLVRRARQANDERVLEIVLTPQGRKLAEAAAAVQRQVEAATGLKPTTFERLRRQLDALAARSWEAAAELEEQATR